MGGNVRRPNASVCRPPQNARDAILIYANNAGGQFINSKYPPASFFYRSPTGPEYDLTGTYNLQFQVVSNPPIILPQFCVGGGWKTSIVLVNMDSTTVTYTLRFWTGDGQPLPVPIASEGEVTATLAPARRTLARSHPTRRLCGRVGWKSWRPGVSARPPFCGRIREATPRTFLTQARRRSGQPL